MNFDYLVSSACTDLGQRRSSNQDAVLCLPEYGIFCVADGIGGGFGGEMASRTVVDSLRRELNLNAEHPPMTFRKTCSAVRHGLTAANTKIRAGILEAGASSGGSTVVVMVFDPKGGRRARIYHSGDSRLYRFRNGELKQLTIDHNVGTTVVAERLPSLSTAVRSMITRAIGLEEAIHIEKQDTEIESSDVFLLCTDGLSGMIGDDGISSFLSRNPDLDLDACCEGLIEEANDAGGLDNISVVLVRVGRLNTLPNSKADGSTKIFKNTSLSKLKTHEMTREEKERAARSSREASEETDEEAGNGTLRSRIRSQIKKFIQDRDNPSRE